MTAPDLPIAAPVLKSKRPLNYLQRIIEIFSPSPRLWRGAAWALLGGVCLLLGLSAGWIFWAGGPVQTVGGILGMLLLVVWAAALLAFLTGLPGRLPFFYRMALAAGLLVTILIGYMGLVYLVGILTTALALVVGLSLIGAGIHGIRQPELGSGQPLMGRLRRSVAILGTLVGGILVAATLVFLAYPGTPLERSPLENTEGMFERPMDMPDPSLPGEYPVANLCYGSPEGRRSEPCTELPEIETRPVDGAAFVEGWNSLRRSSWGFGPEAMPLNAKVWYPQGQGPFPLVLIVHGNAPMEKPSHGGYAYLAELLASRGFVVASIDENFLNLSFFSDLFLFSGLKEENDARGWLLLEHLRLWHAWDKDPSNPLYGMVDLERIALIGHSRGGEAVAVAAAFNQMPYYPDDARVAFDYGYAIQAVAAIAPSDGQYTPGGEGILLKDVSYLVLQGAHDMDVVSFMGAKQYERVRFTEKDFKFKAGLYVDGANHGQFNTTWGRKDTTEPLARFFNLRQLMQPEDQRQIASVYLTAFLETTLRNQPGYLPLFQDARAGASWLPDGIYLSQYTDSETLLISDYEEDVDPSTASLAGGFLEGNGLTVWYEKAMPARWGSSENRVVYLGWRGVEAPDAETRPASYELALPGDLETSQESVLVFSLAGTNEDPCPDEDCRKSRPEAYRPPEFFDLTVEVVDGNGQIARLPLSGYTVLRPPLETKLAKDPFPIVLPESQIVLQHFEFTLSAFLETNPAFDPSALRTLRLVFDRTAEGVVVLDQVGVRQE